MTGKATPTANNDEAPVLIVGGSLVGLAAAVFLAWHGTPVVVLEKHYASSAHPRAIGFTTRTMELFRQVDIEVPASVQATRPPRRARVHSLAGDWLEEYPWSRRGRGAYGAEASPVRATAITQDRLEPILRERARALGAELQLGVEVLALTQDRDGVRATVRRRDDGYEYQLRAQYAVAADGGDSNTREALGITRHGQGRLSVQRSILFRAPLEEYLDAGVVQFEIDQPEFRAFLTTYSDGRWVLMLSDDIDRDDQEQIRAVQRAIGRDDVPIELVTAGRWELTALVADQFSAGRVFLAGDAAHQLPPNRGGFGANTGIEDAHNLAWKLAAVLAGRSERRLLDSYDAERRPIADLRHDQLFARADYKAYLETAASSVPVLDDTAIELGQLYRSAVVVGASEDLPPARRPEEWAGQPGTRAAHLWMTVAGERRSTLDLFHGDWTLLSEDGSWPAAAARVGDETGIPVVAVRLGRDAVPVDAGAFRSAYGLEPGGAVLIRPDGYVAWRTLTLPDDPALALAAALRVAAATPPLGG